MKVILLFLVMTATGVANAKVCDLLPKNDRRIPVGANFVNAGMTQQRFNELLDRVEQVYAPVIRARGANLQVIRDWENPEVNAFADRSGNTWIIHMFGGAARAPENTDDGFTLIACHELGHHLGGVPKKFDWASAEGQSDYWATLKCARRVWARDNNGAVMSGVNVPASVRRNCQESSLNSEDAALCERSAIAGKALGALLADGAPPLPDFETPDRSQVQRTQVSHPAAQCRLDTYYAGAVCDVDVNVEVSDQDSELGVCGRGKTRGVRPRCWYKPTGGLEEEDDIRVILAAE